MTARVFYRVSAAIPKALEDRVSEALDEYAGALAVAVGEVVEAAPLPAGQTSAELLYDRHPDLDRVRLALAAAGLASTPELEVAEIADADWVTTALRDLTELRVGRVHIYGSHHTAPPRDGRIPLRIDAGLAFGTGHHDTTQGVLLALEYLARRSTPVRLLDVGTGTGVLAMAMASRFSRPVLATDIDPVAVAVTRENIRINGLRHLVRAVTAPGLRHPEIMRGAPYDLVVANILAGPLIAMAGQIARALSPGGRVVLSGILGWQAQQVLSAYRAHGLIHERRLSRGDWATLLVRKPVGG